MISMTRPYKLKSRAERQDQTRQKIIEAAIHLHQTRGIAATSMNDIAEQAQVGKVTVYRHFPDLEAVTGSCSATFFGRNPFPNPEAWRSIQDPAQRLRLGLKETWGYYATVEEMMTRVYAEVRDAPVMAPWHDHWAKSAEVILAAWPARGRKKVLLKAAIALALDYETWRTLVGSQGLSVDQAIDLMVRLTCDCPPE
jgi:AcrR family transcriptional regulator